ncbi:MAG TPA: ferric reductase-like transmembrane domain-containing protein, partial [Acidimicrobiia bacterium]|nr:ferric reductase-like transmembrane domain-containing protein [Acidimicrobiia bacterium]
GLTALVALTLSVVLGIVTSVRWANPRWPRFVIELLHRNVSLVAFALIVVHVFAVVADAFAPIGLKDTLLPFVSVYRPVWLGLGAAASDLVLAVLVTSLLRHRMSHRVWRFVHWFSYAAWALIIVHGLGTGSDSKLGLVLVLYAACIAAVTVAVWWRLAVGWREQVGVRLTALAATVVAPIVLVVWLGSGPLAAGWSRRAGTPASILARVTAASSSSSASSTPATAPPTTAPASAGFPAPPFTATLSGTQNESARNAAGQVTVQLALTMSGGASGTLTVDLNGQPLDGGGVLMQSSTVTVGPANAPTLYRGTVAALRGERLTADVTSSGRAPLQLAITVQPSGSGNALAGDVSVSAGGASP